MRVARELEEASQFGPTAVTIGNFDGVHLGHRRLLDEVKAAAAEQGIAPAVLTFDPHPASIVAPERVTKLLSTHAERCSEMAKEGIEFVLILPFTKLVSLWTPEHFVEKVLAKALRAKVVVVGANFRFGNKQAGDTNTLSDLGRKYGFEVRVLKPVTMRGVTVSSSRIRQALEAGEISLARRMLARPYSLSGEVVPGRGIGSKQTVPTLNLKVPGMPPGASISPSPVLPATGVYITCTTDLIDESRSWESITNIGYRPTFGGERANELSIETFLLSAFEPPTPSHIRVQFFKRVRDERKFESAEALKAQILRDVKTAQRYFQKLRKVKRGTPQPALK